ncbi:MAG TPA: hypothetical protein VM581_03505 [Magnetospirillaceae bacterium]|nr:hypothetical protein [Magnetospirillaceae bacterium]
MEQRQEPAGNEAAAEQDSINSVFEATLTELAEGDAAAIEASLKRLFARALRFSPDLAEELAFLATDHLPRPRPAEYGVRVLKSAEITTQERERLLLRVAAYVITAPDALFSPNEAFECSSLAINYAASLLGDEHPQPDQTVYLRAALEDYAVILHDYLEHTVNQMADSRTAAEYATQLTAATVISELETDLREVYTGPQSQAIAA